MCSVHLVLKPPGQFSLWVLYLHLCGPEVDRVCSVSIRWQSPHTILVGKDYSLGIYTDGSKEVAVLVLSETLEFGNLQ